MNDKILKWLENGFRKNTDKVVAYSFNLYETSSGFGIELIGAPSFDENNEDWACREIYVHSPRKLQLSKKDTGSTWQECLKNVHETLKNILELSSPTVDLLKRSKAIAVGFVDGNLEIVWKP